MASSDMRSLRFWSTYFVQQDWLSDGGIPDVKHMPAEWIELFYDLIFAAMAVREDCLRSPLFQFSTEIDVRVLGYHHGCV